MKLTDKQSGNLIMLFVIFLFALNIPVSKYMLSAGYISPYGLTLARVLFGASAFWITSLFISKESVAKKDHIILFLSGILGIASNQCLFLFGLSNTSPIDASIITTSSPLFAMIVAALILKEPITTKKVCGILLGAAGAIYLVLSTYHPTGANDASIKGNLAITGSSLSYATYLVISRPLSSKYSAVTIMKWMFLYAALLLSPFFFNELFIAPVFHQSNAQPFMFIGYTLLFATFIPYMLIPLVQTKIRATTISMYNNLQPLIASFVAIYLGQDQFSIEKVIAGIVILSGVYLVTQSKSRAEVEAALQESADSPK
ncbi:MAG: hypothetical protein RL662_1402 [Bacteroidota bacterium]|jgi:drug/metabolite transporter (DMT)-like permease